MDEDESAQADAQAVPAPKPPQGGFFSRIESDGERVLAAVEAWYAKHFHRASVEGRAPLPAEDKAALVAAVTEAVSAKQE